MWTQQNNSLRRTFSFPDFITSFAFVSKVSLVAERLGHHPNIRFTWGEVEIITTTHDAGNQVTDKDYQLAKQIDELLQ